MTQLLTLTETAAQHIKALMAEQNFTALRVGVTASGCSGMSFSLEPASDQSALDIVVEDKGVKLFVDMKAQLYIAGMELDYFESQFESGFVFNNPNATGHCGCGKSFKTT
jgi:iron-sulfur cluster assembly protein